MFKGRVKFSVSGIPLTTHTRVLLNRNLIKWRRGSHHTRASAVVSHNRLVFCCCLECFYQVFGTQIRLFLTLAAVEKKLKLEKKNSSSGRLLTHPSIGGAERSKASLMPRIRVEYSHSIKQVKPSFTNYQPRF